MSQVIWVNTLIENEAKGDAIDRPLILKFSGKLDKLCAEGRKFSELVDYTDAQANMTGDFQGFDDGWELLREKAKWFEPSEGISVISVLLETIRRENPKFGLLQDKRDELVTELEGSIAVLKGLPSGAKFHFGVVQ